MLLFIFVVMNFLVAAIFIAYAKIKSSHEEAMRNEAILLQSIKVRT